MERKRWQMGMKAPAPRKPHDESMDTAAHERAESPEFEAKEHGVPVSQGAALRRQEIKDKMAEEKAGKPGRKYQLNKGR